ncbi:hypothetical protein ACFQ9V_08410 [Leifsonia sp. NPDC056665]|uniref:hypothetical protein n=1 Tax=Leifsonia sp. NPDC056665 TaxID=3345901 RepID=UPI0036C1031F
MATAPPPRRGGANTVGSAARPPGPRPDLRTRLAESVDEADRPVDDRPESLARVATDLEVTRPGSLERVLGPLLPAVAAFVMASPVAIALFPYGYAAGSSVWQDDADDDSPLL